MALLLNSIQSMYSTVKAQQQHHHYDDDDDDGWGDDNDETKWLLGNHSTISRGGTEKCDTPSMPMCMRCNKIRCMRATVAQHRPAKCLLEVEDLVTWHAHSGESVKVPMSVAVRPSHRIRIVLRNTTPSRLNAIVKHTYIDRYRDNGAGAAQKVCNVLWTHRRNGPIYMGKRLSIRVHHRGHYGRHRVTVKWNECDSTLADPAVDAANSTTFRFVISQ